MPERHLAAKVYINRVDAQYPQVEGLPGKAVENHINNLIKVQVHDLVPRLVGEEMEVFLKSVVEVNKKSVFSIRTEVYKYIHRHANGTTVVRSLTVDLETGKVYRLHDLFKPGSRYVEVLSEMIRQQIEEQKIPLIKEFHKIRPNQSYYLTEYALIIYFQELKYTPHYVGVPEFAIPFTSILNLVSERGPIAKLLDP